MNYNHCVFVGRLTADAEMRVTTEGTSRTKFTIAINKKFKRDQAIFLPVVTWGKLAEICNEYLRKGSLVLVDGELDIRQYEKDGEKKIKEFLEK